jgi:hypothetical protein
VVAGVVREGGRVVGEVMGETVATDQVAAETEVAVVMAVTMGEEKVVEKEGETAVERVVEMAEEVEVLTAAAREEEAGVEASIRPFDRMNERREESVIAARTRTERGRGEEVRATPARKAHFPERESRPTRRAKWEESW